MLTRTQGQAKPDTRKPMRYLPVQRQHNNVRETFQRPFPNIIVLTLNRKMPAKNEQITNNLLFCKPFGL